MLTQLIINKIYWYLWKSRVFNINRHFGQTFQSKPWCDTLAFPHFRLNSQSLVFFSENCTFYKICPKDRIYNFIRGNYVADLPNNY